MHGTVVGVLRGGASSEHEISLQSGHAILTHLPKGRFTARDIYIDRQGVWHDRGRPTTPDRVLPTLDVVIAPLHGRHGENGQVQRLLEQFGVPYVGADSFNSYLAMHKVLAKEKAKEMGLLTARYSYVERGMDVDAIAAEVNRTFSQPVVVKPVDAGSSVGVSMVHGYVPIREAVEAMLLDPEIGGVLIEERIQGKEATVGVIEGMRGEEYYVLPPTEIVPPGSDFFSYESKYSGKSEEICPGRFSKAESKELMRAAQLIHKALGQRHYSRSDFIVTKRGIYYLETNSAAAVGMTSESLMPKALEAVGVKFADFLAHIADMALHKKPL